MADDEEEFSEVEIEEETPSYAWSKDRTVYLVMDFASKLQLVTADFFASLTEQAGADHNRKIDDDVFRQEVAKEIETLPSFKEPKE